MSKKPISVFRTGVYSKMSKKNNPYVPGRIPGQGKKGGHDEGKHFASDLAAEYVGAKLFHKDGGATPATTDGDHPKT